MVAHIQKTPVLSQLARRRKFGASVLFFWTVHCAAVGGFAAYGCGVPLAGKAERAEEGTSGTLVTEILGAPQRETVKEKLVKCVLAPR